MKKIIDITGKKFGKLTVITESKVRKYNRVTWYCRCDCGRDKFATSNDLQSGKVKTCGNKECRNINTEAAHKAVTTHQQSGTRLYSIWINMKQRCDKNLKNYEKINYCKKWKQFEMFYIWSINNGYNNKLTLDRKNNYNNYSPRNCRWATMKTQGRNRRNNRLITYKGKTYCVNEWAEILNINTRTLIHRINYGWSIERAFTTTGGKYEG